MPKQLTPEQKEYLDVWFERLWVMGLKCKDLWYGQQGQKTGKWRQDLYRHMLEPDLYKDYREAHESTPKESRLYRLANGLATLEDNCEEVLEFFKADIEVKRKRKAKGLQGWYIPMFSVYFGDGKRDGKGQRYLWELQSVSDYVKPKDDKIFKAADYQKGSEKTAREFIGQMKGLLK